jgi:hypothetical protein
MFGVKLQAAWASSDHLFDLPRLLSQERSDAVVIDCLMFGALGGRRENWCAGGDADPQRTGRIDAAKG